MIEGITLSFAVGLFAVVCPSAIAFALALAGLPLAPSGDWTHGVRAAVVMGASFAAVFAIAGLADSAGLERAFDAIPWIAAAAGVVLALAGLRVAAGEALPHGWPAAAVGAVFALAAIPSMLTVFSSLVDQSVEAAGPGAAVGVTIGFGAGCASALTLPVLASTALARAAQRPGALAGRAAGALVALAGAWIVVYWLPALFGGRIERGGAVESVANDVSSSLTEVAARYELGFALVLLAISALGLAVAAHPGPGLQRDR
jgi:cytochrome c-type biogenesis protein